MEVVLYHWVWLLGIVLLFGGLTMGPLRTRSSNSASKSYLFEGIGVWGGGILLLIYGLMTW